MSTNADACCPECGAQEPAWNASRADPDSKNAEIARLQESVNYRQIADNHHQELMAEKEEEITRLQSALEEIHSMAFRGESHVWIMRAARRALAEEGK